MPPRRKVYEEESEDEASDVQSEPIEDDELEMDVDDEAAEEGDDIDVIGDGTHDDEAVVDDKDVVEEDIEDELIDDVSETEGLSSPAPSVRGPIIHPRLKIKLKLPQVGPSSSHSIPPRARRQAARGSDIESEDEDEEDEDEEGGGSTRSTSVATAGAGGRALTARQAVLANVVDSSHVSLAEPPNPRKKKPLTEIEMALKREETARKRRNLTEKKLEDEKAETINRLLKKQSRARGRRNALSTAEDRPGPGENVQGEGEDDEIAEVTAPPPTMYRWVSSSRSLPKQEGQQTAGAAGTERVMSLSFSVPMAVVPTKGEHTMDVDSGSGAPQRAQRLHRATPPTCDVQGCTAERKYRLVRDFHRGACGIGHLKMLEAQTV